MFDGFALLRNSTFAQSTGVDSPVNAFTDGLIEARNPEGEEFGEERLIQCLTKVATLNAATIEEEILRAIKEWTHEAEQEDDLTLVIFKVV